METERKKRARVEIEKLQTKILNDLQQGTVSEETAPAKVVSLLLKYIDIISPIRELSHSYEKMDKKNDILEREHLIRDFVLPIGFECYEYLDSPDVMDILYYQWKDHFSKFIKYKREKTQELADLKKVYDSLCEEYDREDSLMNHNHIDFLSKANELTREIECLENKIKREEMSVPDIGDFLRDAYLKEVDREYYSKKNRKIISKRFSTMRIYWEILKEEILNSFPGIDWLRMFKYPEDTYILHIPIEDWWWKKISSRTLIENLYLILIERGLINNVSLDSFLRIFSYPINVNWWEPIEWVGKYSKDKKSSGNLTMLWCLISALRNWDWFQDFCDIRRNQESDFNRTVSEILTQADRDKISLFFRVPSGGTINQKSLKLAKDCDTSLFYIEELIKTIIP